MTDRRFGMFVVSGNKKSGKTTLLQKYLDSMPANLRIDLVSEKQSEWRRGIVPYVEEINYDSKKEEINKAVSNRTPVVVFDNNITSKNRNNVNFERLALASVNTNTAVSTLRNEPTFMGALRDGILQDTNDETLITNLGVIGNLKGIALTHVAYPNGSPFYMVKCLEVTEDVASIISNPYIKDSRKEQLLNAAVTEQGYLSFDEQFKSVEQINISAITKMAVKSVFDAGKGLIVLNAEENIRIKTMIDLASPFTQEESRNAFSSINSHAESELPNYATVDDLRSVRMHYVSEFASNLRNNGFDHLIIVGMLDNRDFRKALMISRYLPVIASPSENHSPAWAIDASTAADESSRTSDPATEYKNLIASNLKLIISTAKSSSGEYCTYPLLIDKESYPKLVTNTKRNDVGLSQFFKKTMAEQGIDTGNLFE